MFPWGHMWRRPFLAASLYCDSCILRQLQCLPVCLQIRVPVSSSITRSVTAGPWQCHSFWILQYYHITLLLCWLHWLKASEQIDLSLLPLLYKCLRGATPSCFADELCLSADLSPQRRLRSAPFSSLVVRRTLLSTIGDRAFPVAAAHVWNGMPQHVTSASSLSTFCRRLKTHLFQRCFPWLFVSCLSSDFCHFRTR